MLDPSACDTGLQWYFTAWLPYKCIISFVCQERLEKATQHSVLHDCVASVLHCAKQVRSLSAVPSFILAHAVLTLLTKERTHTPLQPISKRSAISAISLASCGSSM